MKKLIFLLLNLFYVLGFANNLQFAIIGDAGNWNQNTALLKKSILAHNIDSLIMPGDNVYKGTYDQAWSPWIADQFKFEVTAIGNHHNGYQNEVNFFKMPAEFYSKNYNSGTVEYIVLNSDNTKTVNLQLQWLETTLIESTAKQIYLVYHHPSLTVGEHKWTEKKQFQIGMRSLIKKYRSKISGVIVGHDHIASLLHFDNLPVIVSGSTQNPDQASPIDNIQENVRVKTALLFSGKPYWIKQIVYPEKSDFIFIRATDHRELCTATIQTGQPALHNCIN